MKSVLQIDSNNRQWYGVHVRAHCEKKVSALLTKKKIECYYPVLKVSEKGRYGMTANSDLPVFPSIIFICVDKTRMREIIETDGVINFLFWRDQYAVISHRDISRICDFCEHNNGLWVEKTAVAGGEFVPIESVGDLRRISLPTLGYILGGYAKESETVQVFATA